jgi:16S rRNA (adenine1518-N6/adenine1519-N6)-dimethyltransferase
VPRAPGGRGRHPPALKKFGQHFLSDEKILTAIVDRALAKLLRDRYASRPTVEIVEGDFLEADLGGTPGDDFLLIGNVPYNITTPIVFRALEPPMPKRSVFLVQREVAERMAAREDTESYGALSVNVAAVASVEQVLTVPASAFRPPPKVESAVVRLTPRVRPLVALDQLPAFRAFVQAAFGLRRKQMQRVLRTATGLSSEQAAAVLDRSGIEQAARPEVLSPEKFAELFALI